MAHSDKYRSSTTTKIGVWQVGSLLHKRTMLFFIVLLMMATLLAGLAIYHNRAGGELASAQQAQTVIDSAGGMAQSQQHGSLEGIIMAVAIAIVVVLVLFMLFLRAKVIKPLHRLDALSKRMADGSLDMLADDEQNINSYVDAIGENVNSLAMNLQEVLLLVWNQSEHNLKVIKETLSMVNGNDDIPVEQVRKNLEEMESELHQMQELTRQFELFDVVLEGKRALAKDDFKIQ